MRSYEAAAIGGCILAENTEDHRRLFGPEGQSAMYFDGVEEMVRKAKRLNADGTLRQKLSSALKERMTTRSDTYADRLREILTRVKAIAHRAESASAPFGETIVC